MSMKFGTGGANGSSLGVQFLDKFWSKVAVKEARKKIYFSQLGEKLIQPKNFGDKIVKYHEVPIIHPLNINDQGIDANGAVLVSGKFFAYDAAGAMVGSAAGYATKELALAVGTAVSVKSGNGNIYGGDTDFAVVKGSFPALREEGGKVNAVGMKRFELSANVKEYGFHIGFTQKMLDMDTEQGLLARISTEIGLTQGELREKQIECDLITASEANRVYAGDATTLASVGAGDVLDFLDIRAVEQSLRLARSPSQTKIIDGSTNVGTVVVGSGYVAYAGQEMRPTLEDLTYNGAVAWRPVETYAAAGKIMENEIGKVSVTRFIEVENMVNYYGKGADSTDATDDTDVANRHVGANGKYTVFPILYVARVVTAMPKPDAINDPFGKNGSVAISWFHATLITRPERIRQIVCSAKIL